MITETEMKALELAKKVFEHFTHDALPIAREILAMEVSLGQLPKTATPVNGQSTSAAEVKITDRLPLAPGTNTSPSKDTSLMGLADELDPSQPVRQLNPELVTTVDEDFPL